MGNAIRLFNCLGCHCQVFICSDCDRGNIYCGQVCAQAARTRSLREARQRYQKSRQGRLKHAQRQQRYRQCKKEKVTDQGSLFQTQYVQLEKMLNKDVIPTDATVICTNCHFCGKHRSSFMRIGFLRRENKIKIEKHSAFSLGP